MKAQKKTQSDYDKKYRDKNNLKSFSVRTNAERIEKLNKKLLKDNKTKVEFLNNAIDEYTKKDWYIHAGKLVIYQSLNTKNALSVYF